MFGAEAYELEPLEKVDEQDLFLSILYHDARGGNAIRMLLGEEDGKKPYVRHFANKDYHKIGYRAAKYNAYASVNTFRSYRRSSDEVYNLSGIFIDLDGHDFKTVKAMDAAIEKTKARLQTAYCDGEVTAPTMITYTGRGLGIFYILSSSIANSPKAQKSIRYLEQVRAALTAKYKHILSGRGYLEVDTTVKDHARVCRIPLTLNKKINRWCRLIYVSYTDDGEVSYCDLNQLARDNHLFDEVNRVKRGIAAQKVVSLDAYRLPFLTIRIQKLELLQELRRYECSGSREYMTFIYYNAAKQIYGAAEATIATKEFNQRFIEPLGDTELEHAFHVTDKNIPPTGDYKGFYKLPDAWIVDVLEVTDAENAKCHFGASKRQIERQNRREENFRKREERNKQIADYIKANPEETYPEIASRFEVSESMLYRICKQYEIRRNKVKVKVDENPSRSNEEAAKVLEISPAKNLQNLSQSLLGVSSAGVSGNACAPDALFIEVPDGRGASEQDDLIQAYVDLYGQVTEKRKRQRQIPGQIAFRWDSGGDIEYYIVS